MTTKTNPTQIQTVKENELDRKYNSNMLLSTAASQIPKEIPEIPHTLNTSPGKLPSSLQSNSARKIPGQPPVDVMPRDTALGDNTGNGHEEMKGMRHPTPNMTFHRRTSKNKFNGKGITLGKKGGNQSDIVSGVDSPAGVPNFNDTTNLQYKSSTSALTKGITNPVDAQGVQGRYNMKYDLTRNMPLNISGGKASKTANLTGVPVPAPTKTVQTYPLATTNSGGTLKSFPPRVSNRKTGGKLEIYILCRSYTGICCKY